MGPAHMRSLFVEYEPVCDRCGHGVGLHAEFADVECVACVERGYGLDCASYSSSGATPPWGAQSTGGRVRLLQKLTGAWH